MFCRRKLGLWATAGGAAWEPAPGVGAGRGGAPAGLGAGSGGEGGAAAGRERVGGEKTRVDNEVGISGQFRDSKRGLGTDTRDKKED